MEPRSALADTEPIDAASLAMPAPGAERLRRARADARAGRHAEARRWLAAAVDAGDDFTVWQPAATLLAAVDPEAAAPRRTARLAVLGSYTTAHLVPLLRLAAWRLGIRLETYAAGYAQYRQEILDPGSGLWAFAPDFVLLAVHHGELRLPVLSEAPEEDVEREVARWTALWDVVAARSGARVIQHLFALPAEAPLGHLGATLPGSRPMTTQAVNARLGARAGGGVSVVDCERLSALVGKERWFDPRLWHSARQAVALAALPGLARHTAAVLAAALGLSRKCLVLDLDGTLWGGVIGEDGPTGIQLGEGAAGEAFVAFQEHLLALKRKGVVLAVCSKNNEADAREVFEKHSAMRLRLDDFAAFVANWDPKPRNLERIARDLGLGLDALAFADDDPAECEAVRAALPEVDVIPLSTDPAHHVSALAAYLLFETAALTAEDGARTAQYRARAAAALASTSGSLADFQRSLGMQAAVTPFDDDHLPRIAQLLGKTNQFNVTARRHGVPRLRAFMADPRCVHLALRLRDRFADHGLVAVLIAVAGDGRLDIDTWLMSCRVIGRNVEAAMLAEVCARAAALGCARIRGTYVPTPKNVLVADVFTRYGFDRVGERDGITTWEYDLAARGPVDNPCIDAVPPW